ncbi:MAG TPA: hypothetical protein VJ952_13300 [Opitutales bacterium]|nr:hypothetical protein [Opitutales bacterium]
MPYHIEWRDRGVYWTYTGLVTGDDILQSNFDIYGDARFDDLKYEIVNLLEAEKIGVSERHMQKIAHLDAAAARTNTNIRVAIVAREADAVYLQKLYTKHSKDHGWPTQLFESVQAAEAWVKRG